MESVSIVNFVWPLELDTSIERSEKAGQGSFTPVGSGKRQRAGGATDVKLHCWCRSADDSSLPSRAELQRDPVARSVKSGKSPAVSFTLDISG